MRQKSNITPVILCGGNGTRLWPLSRELYPKPFLKMGDGGSLFRNTLERAKILEDCKTPIILSNEEHRFYIMETLAEAGIDGRVILEPEPRNTAPALCLAALALRGEGQEDDLMLVMPSDHYFEDSSIFCQTVIKAMPIASQGHIVTFGITPARPDSGYGYIEQGKAIDDFCYAVNRFVEKPDAEKAAQMLANGNYYWNSGIFFLSARRYLEELRKFAPDILAACENAWTKKTEDEKFIRPDPLSFLEGPENSIDYAIMEKTDKAAMAPLPCAWSDMGSWEAFYTTSTQDNNGNVCEGDVFMEDTRNSYIHSEDRLVAAIGVRDMVIVESSDAVLVMPRERSQEVKKVASYLKENNREECRFHPLVYRPWGSYERLVAGSRFQVKRIIVKPDCSLSLQMHHHRSEHWIVVSGTAEITIDGKTSLYTENQSVYIPLGSSHKLRNPGIIPLELIEVQSGSYLGEDDIVRYDDDYGRK